jgi:hypothetical protein
MSVTSKQILEATGLKSPKTLTRWAKRGIIPGPHVATHPSGRGKIAYWPDSVLERCRRVAELLRQGHTLGSALSLLGYEQTLRVIEEGEKSADFDTVLSKKIVHLANGQETNLDLFIHAFIAQLVDKIYFGESLRRKLFVEMHNANVASWSLKLFEAGYNPVCLFDGERIEVVPDFMVSHLLSEEESVQSARLVVPILPPLRKAFSALGRPLPSGPLTHAAPKVWGREGDAIVEYQMFLGGALGFELIRETANTVGIAQAITKSGCSHDE